MGVFNDFFGRAKCTALKVSPLFWQAVGHVFAARSVGTMRNYDDCMRIGIPPTIGGIGDDIKECACHYVFDQIASGPVVVFEDGDFQGRNQALGYGWSLGIHGALDEVGNDAISSVIVGDGYIADLFLNADAYGPWLRLMPGLYPSIPPEWNDKISAAHVYKTSDPH